MVGTILGSEVTRRHGPQGLPDDTIQLTFQGSAGQSFGAFIPRGITLTLEGDANDYVGKGLSGGRIVVYPAARLDLRARAEHDRRQRRPLRRHRRRGLLLRRGRRALRVRNSGVNAVVEAVGDHGCEYMTGGRVVVLGLDRPQLRGGHVGRHRLRARRGRRLRRALQQGDGAALPAPTYSEEIDFVKDLVFRHAQLTGSGRAKKVLVDWDYFMPRFVRVVPNDYNRVLQAQRKMRETGLSPEEAEMAAFEQNVQDVARVGGK